MEDAQLVRVPRLRVDLFQVALAWLERVVVDRCAGLADEDAVVQLEVRGLVPQTVNAVGIVLVLSHSLPQDCFQLF